MAQILEDPRNLGYSVGKGVGTGISSGLQELASKKIERLNQQHQYQEKVKGLKALRIPDAEQLAHLDNKSLQSLIEAKIQEPSNERFASSVDRIVGNEQQQPAQNSLQSLLPQSENQDRQGQLQQYLNDPDMMSKFQEKLKSPEVLQQFSPEQLAQVTERLKGLNQQPQQEPIIKAGLNQKQALDLAKLGLEKKRSDEKDALDREKLQDKREEKEHARQKELHPFLLKEAESFKSIKHAKTIAQRMLDNLNKNSKKFPGAITGNLPVEARSVLLRDPDVRRYDADSNSLVAELVNARKGQPTNYKLKLERLAKADLSQPIETQKEILESIIATYDDAAQRQKYMQSLKDKNDGKYPGSIQQDLIELELAQDKPLEYPQYYQEGTVYVDDDGKEYVLKNGKWQEA